MTIEIIKNANQTTVKWFDESGSAGFSRSVSFQSDSDLLEFCEVFEIAKNIITGKKIKKKRK